MVRWHILVVGLATAYLAAGRAVAYLSVQPGHGAPVWPSAGIALGALLLGGRYRWPGVWAGAFFLALWTTHERGGGVEVAAFLPCLVIATGATLQALWGDLLIRRWVGVPTPLVRERDIFLFLAAAGPVHALVSATCGITMLCLVEVHPWARFPLQWATWWVGDAIGGAVVTPLVLILFAQPRAVWRARAWTIGLPMVLMLGGVTAFFFLARAWEKERLRYRLNDIPKAVGARVRTEFDRTIHALGTLRDKLHPETLPESASDRKQLLEALTFLRLWQPLLTKIAYCPFVPRDERGVFEAQLDCSTDLPEFQIQHWAADLKVPLALENDPRGDPVNPISLPHVCIMLTVPADKGQLPRGLDLTSVPSFERAYKRLREGRVIVTPPLIRNLAAARQPRGLLFLPVFRSNPAATPATEPGPVVCGCFTALFDLSALVTLAKWELGVPDSLPVELIDPRWQTATPAPRDGLRVIGPVQLGERSWTLSVLATADLLAEVHAWEAWGALVAGLTLSSLLCALLLLLSGRTVVVEEAVTRRTQELTRAMQERTRAEEALR